MDVLPQTARANAKPLSPVGPHERPPLKQNSSALTNSCDAPKTISRRGAGPRPNAHTKRSCDVFLAILVARTGVNNCKQHNAIQHVNGRCRKNASAQSSTIIFSASVSFRTKVKPSSRTSPANAADGTAVVPPVPQSKW